MTRFPMVGKATYELVLDRRVPIALLLVSALLTLTFGFMTGQTASNPASPMDFVEPLRFVGPIIVGLFAIALAGDAISRERQDGTIRLLFTAPATLTRYWAALTAAHVLAFATLTVVTLAFAALVGVVAGWVALKATLILVGLALFPLFLTLDMGLLAASARFTSGRTSLVVATLTVVVLWGTGSVGPLGELLKGVDLWSYVSPWHPFDLAYGVGSSLLDEGMIAWQDVGKAYLEAAAAAGIAWASLIRMEVGL